MPYVKLTYFSSIWGSRKCIHLFFQAGIIEEMMDDAMETLEDQVMPDENIII